jgi:ABC transporter substrate binding protein
MLALISRPQAQTGNLKTCAAPRASPWSRWSRPTRACRRARAGQGVAWKRSTRGELYTTASLDRALRATAARVCGSGRRDGAAGGRTKGWPRPTNSFDLRKWWLRKSEHTWVRFRERRGVTDPVAQGIVESLARPGGNATGFFAMEPSVGGKWLELLKEIVPGLRRVAVIFNPETSTGGPSYLRSVETAAPLFSVEVTGAPVHHAGDIELAISSLVREPGGGLIVLPDPFTASHYKQIVELAARYRLPAIYAIRDYVNEGGLMSYGTDAVDMYRRAASYVDQILKGANPANLPVQAQTKFGLVINLKTAKALGLTVPPSLLDRADEVIE